ncbi:hypothetical protein BXZ70DRAFT_1001679 [Cristinia sonorae]|uniref:Uncharacterized protein n=1 Tax=Cristinia sonorae TaxID=1940300 RepID=A0A8K0XMK3_9AGAR|nr:hypothetical protein BXZ70DRAFT_1001679 [Cristinia sonorae]
MSNTDVDFAFSVLPLTVRHRIDRAFDLAIEQSTAADRPAKKRKLHNDDGGFIPTTPGGFIVGEPQQGGFVMEEPLAGGFVADVPSNAGGFVIDTDDEPEAQEAVHTRIPLSLIPTALQLLDLQPDDEDVLAVFRNAAAGWDNSDGRAGTASQSESFVERRDWQAVCTALLEPADGWGKEEGGDPDVDMEDNMRQEAEESSVGSGDDFQDPLDEDSPDYDDANDSDDDYAAPSREKGKGKARAASTAKTYSRKRTATMSGSEEEVDDLKDSLTRITPRQRKECRRTFALFFPDIEDKDLDTRRLMIKDITRVAKVLKEKITAEEIIEMLEVFSTSADKSMSLADFERMMITAKLA